VGPVEPVNQLRVALTFDAEHPSRRQCPPGAAAAIVATLAEHDVRASFFFQGRWVTAYPDLTRAIGRDGHLIGNHSHSHAPMPALSDQGLAAEIDMAEASIRNVLGVDPRPWFRCPFGAGADDPRVLEALATRGYRNVHWDVAASDWEDDRTAKGVENDVVDGVLKRGDGVIVLLHTWPEPTVGALGPLVERLRTAGCRFVSAAEVMDGR
jgi:peptidoglycan/xylan/chitin deacetylase (PgdA/CDA1 family)